MGIIVSYIFPANTGRTDDPDSVTGLTSRDKYLVKTSWARVMKEPTDSGVALLILFFKQFPQYVELFPFKDVPQAEFSTNARFRAHANSVVYALSAIVDALNDNDLLIQLLLKTGTSHIPRKVTSDGFNHLKEVIVQLFSTLFKPDELVAWKKTLDVAFGVVLKGLSGEKMGLIFSYFYGSRNDDPDPVTGLTSRDKDILRSTWKQLSTGKANLETGMTIFLNLFEKYPEYQELFPFKDLPRDQLKGNDRFKAHCVTVMSGFSALVGNIDSPPVLVQLLLKQGVNHVPRKVPPEAHENLKTVLMELFSKSMNSEQLNSWRKFLDVGFSLIAKGAHQSGDQ